MTTATPTRASQLYTRARESLAGGVSSSFRADVRPEPLFVDHAHGVCLVDVDGNRYLDYTLAWGPLILGHNHPAVMAAVHGQLARGHMFGAQHELEAQVAERIVAGVPSADLVTFAGSGTEAIQVALRLARAYTGRIKWIKFEGHYHGWSDAALVSYHPPLTEVGPRDQPRLVPGTAGQSPAALSEAIVLPWNDIGALEQALYDGADDIAAVMMEPVMCNSGVIAPVQGYLAAVRALTERHHVLLIFDEVITGFRLAFGGAQDIYGVVPDLAVYAKAIAAGFPLSAIAGRGDIMGLIAQGIVAHSGTYNGNPIALAAADAALRELGGPGVYEHLDRVGTMLAVGARSLLRQHGLAGRVNQAGPVVRILFTEQEVILDYRAVAACNDALNAALVQELRAHGVLILPDGRWYLATVHTDEDVRTALVALDSSLAVLAASQYSLP